MSFIHASPLFHPLEPLPIMKPTLMRSDKKTGKRRHDTSSANTHNMSASEKGKRLAVSHQLSHPLANTSLVMPVQDSALHVVPSTTHDDIAQLIAASMAEQLPTSIPQHASYKEYSPHSQEQGSLTFTLESQPMSDLSSSQQLSQDWIVKGGE